MAFKKKSPDGTLDPNIYRGGRSWVHGKKKPNTYKEVGREELLNLYRKVKPHSKEAISVLVELMAKDKSSEGTRIKAAALILQHYRDLIAEIYDNDELINPELATEEQQEPAAVLHLKIVKDADKEKK